MWLPWGCPCWVQETIQPSLALGCVRALNVHMRVSTAWGAVRKCMRKCIGCHRIFIDLVISWFYLLSGINILQVVNNQAFDTQHITGC
jgi:hypothetical protein